MAYHDELALATKPPPLIPCLVVDISKKNYESMTVVSHSINEAQQSAQLASNALQKLVLLMHYNKMSIAAVKTIIKPDVRRTHRIYLLVCLS